MKHSMSPSSQCLSPSTLLDEPHPDHAFDAPRLLRPSSGTFECLPPEHTSKSLPPQRTCSTNSEVTPFGVPSKCLTSEDFVSEYLQPEPRSALSAFTWHVSTRGPTRTTFAATVTELPAPLASSLPLDPDHRH
ncbi:hypothetical protein GUJ93_ZPchr0009g761 [Zizania palustris]|uniref:Uncharacterized protein n=1 Tax=Zizania palustris TaxID=103762 RepID=A0A8J5RQB1_ZIZPA|nr:hypothetical protein GUJ93_ZPchr0009g761 [Zizania palustris]